MALRLEDHFDAFLVAGGCDLALAHVVCDDVAPELVAVAAKPRTSDQLDARFRGAIDDVGGAGLDGPGAGFRLLPVTGGVAPGVDEGDLATIALDDDTVRCEAHRSLVDLHGTRGDHPLGRGRVVGGRRPEPAGQKIAFHIVGTKV